MKKLFTLLTFTVLGIATSFAQSSVSATFSGSNIPANYSSYSASCNLDDTLNIAVPAGALVVGLDVSYTMVATSGAWMMEQRTRLECLNNSQTEPIWYSGSGYGGTYSYNRTDVSVANGVSNGSITLRMQAYRTWGSYGGCNTIYQYIPSGSWSVTVYYCPATPTYTPIISVDTVMATCGDSSVMVSANSSYSSFSWSNGDTTATATFTAGGEYVVYATDSGGCPYPDTVSVSLITPTNMFPTDTTICQGETVELNVYYDPDPCVTMNEFLTTGVTTVDHNSITGDDRGGIAVTPDYFYYTGDSYTGRYNADNMTGGVSLQRRDGLFSDLSSGALYTLWDTLTDTFNVNWPTYSYNSVNAFRMMDADLNTTSTLALSQTINMGSSSFIAAGAGFVILWANYNDTFYHVDLATGDVTTLGTGNMQTSASTGIYMYGSENWAEWGIAECYNGGYAVVGRAYYINGVYQYSPGQIGRWDIANSVGMQVSEFSGSVNDMACITYSPWHKRWYFHHESSSFLGSGSEVAGFADATTGALIPFEISWNNGDSGAVIEVTPDSTMMYVATVSDGVQSCTDTAHVTVTTSPDITFSITDIVCKGDSNGAVSTSISGGTSPYTYMWVPLDTNVAAGSGSGTSINGIPTGDYTLYVEDVNGCNDFDTAYVWEPLSVFSPVLSGEMDPLCSYSEDGEALILPAGGDAPYTYSWSNGVTTAGNTSLGDGAYSVTTTDANGCERVLSGTLEAPSAVVLNLSATGNTCEDDEDGTATSAPTGGTAPYAYSWDNGDADDEATNLTSGYHFLTITDGNGCMFVDSVEVTFENEAPNIPLPDSLEKCNQYSVTLDAGDEGASYLWNTGDTSQVITTNAGGLIIVTVTGENGCEATHSMFIQNNPCPTGVATVDESAMISVYPNPSNGVFNIEVEGNLESALDLQVTDISGRVLADLSGAIQAGSNIATLNLTDLAQGSYLLRMSRNGELVSVKQIVIQ